MPKLALTQPVPLVPTSSLQIGPTRINPQWDYRGAPLLTVLNFSGGKQSSVLLWMVLRGDLPRPPNFAVLVADPGMEDSRTYEYVDLMERECQKAGIEFVRCKGPNLFEDLQSRTKKRIDNPPYFTRDKETGKLGKLVQNCTKEYKIAPMTRAIRELLHRKYGLHPKAGTVGINVVEKWIGFHADEWHRVSESGSKYWYFRFPLIERNMDEAAVIGYFLKHKLPRPPRSVCNACFANSVPYYQDMHANRPRDWQKAIQLDDAIRDMSRWGVKGEVFVSRAMMPLRDMPALDFKVKSPPDEQGCGHGGYCFV